MDIDHRGRGGGDHTRLEYLIKVEDDDEVGGIGGNRCDRLGVVDIADLDHLGAMARC